MAQDNCLSGQPLGGWAANKGLGLETARRLVAAGHTVYIGSRDAERGRRAADQLGARMVPLDVTDDASIVAPVVVNVSSGLASLTRVTTAGTQAYAYPGVAYPASKAAVNMITVQYAKAFPHMRINAVEPGYTATDLNNHAGTQTVEQGAEIIVRMAQVGHDGPTGGYFDRTGPVPW